MNPFYVLLLPTDVTEEDIKQRYHKLSALVHPDKSTHPRARHAFLEIKKAYDELSNTERRDVLSRLVKGAERSARKSLKDENLTESQIKDHCAREVMKVFAQAEQRRRVAKRNSVVYVVYTDSNVFFSIIEHIPNTGTQRERIQENEEKLQKQLEQEQEQQWKAGRDKRMKSWSNFQHGASKNKRQKLYGFDIKMPEVRKEQSGNSTKTTTDNYKKRWR